MMVKMTYHEMVKSLPISRAMEELLTKNAGKITKAGAYGLLVELFKYGGEE